VSSSLPKFDAKAADAIDAFAAEKARWSKRGLPGSPVVMLIRRGDAEFARFDVSADIADNIIEQAAMRAAIEAGR